MRIPGKPPPYPLRVNVAMHQIMGIVLHAHVIAYGTVSHAVLCGSGLVVHMASSAEIIWVLIM